MQCMSVGQNIKGKTHNLSLLEMEAAAAEDKVKHSVY